MLDILEEGRQTDPLCLEFSWSGGRYEVYPGHGKEIGSCWGQIVQPRMKDLGFLLASARSSTEPWWESLGLPGLCALETQ